MKTLLGILFILALSQESMSQDKYFTRTGHVSFHSEGTMEKIEAHNYQVTSFLNTANGELVFSLLIKSFEFKKALMQEHFNENYMESGKFPKAEMKGHILNFDKIDLSKDGIHQIEVEGELTIHGETKAVKIPGTLEIKGEQIITKASFPLPLKDYNVKKPKEVSETIEVRVDMAYEKFKK